MKLGMILAALLLVSCGDKKEPRQGRELTPICGGDEKCLPVIDWSIEMASMPMPENFAILVNNQHAGIKCKGETNIRFSLTPDGRSVMNFVHWLWPKTAFKVEFQDIGLDCKNDASLLVVDQPVYATTTITTDRRPWRSVYVTLD